MKRSIIVIAAMLIAGKAGAQSPAPAIGTWRGTSLCLVRPSPCNDERVVYYITRVGTTDSVAIDARKIVNGQEEEMGVLTCALGVGGTQLTCPIPRSVWRFTVRGDSLIGDVYVADKKYRDVRTARAR